jgi:hypothetical protein
MEKIKKILEINHLSFNILKDFFESFDYSSVDLPNTINNDFVYYDGVSPKDKEVVIDIERTPIGSLNNKIINDSLNKSIEHLKSIYNIKMMWLMTYPPKTYVHFHRDHGKNRHLVSFNNHNRFFSYESYSDFIMSSETENIFNKKYQELKNNVDEFNEYFLQYDESCRICNLNSNSVYTFGNTVHSFINDSDKLRVNLVFEV